ncbi:M28 family metallopeptidase [bacterium]|nr:M28 family metallopeptidase [bacterium]
MQRLIFLFFILFITSLAFANGLIEEPVMKAFSEEISGEAAKRNLEFLSRQHRMRGSRGYKSTVEFIAGELRRYGLEQISIEEFPADGKKFYGTQRSRPPWDADFAELWEMKGTVPAARMASWDAVPLSLAQDSENGDVTALLVDVGDGISESDYANKDVNGKLVLVSQQPEQVVRWAIDKYGAAGMISYAQNQKTAWWAEDENLLRWGHVGTFNKKPAFAFMITLKQARAFQKRLFTGEKIQLHARVVAGQHSGAYQVLTAIIPGADPQLKEQEIVFSCHLDHPRPGANDNASGCATILEVARTYAKLISEKKIARPPRTLRFVWPPEIEGTMAFLVARPQIKKRILSAIHMDMVGGGPVTKAQFRITRGPASRPSFIYDVADHFGKFVNQQTQEFAESGSSLYPLYSLEGGKEPLQAIFAPYSMGSDHDVYAEASFGIPAIYFNDWPDRYIHTNFDTPANIDPTKLKRAGLLGATTAFFLANFNHQHVEKLWPVLKASSLQRTADMLKRKMKLPQENANALSHFHFWYEERTIDSLKHYTEIPEAIRKAQIAFLKQLSGFAETDPRIPSKKGIVYSRNDDVPGPMGVFGYNYLQDHFGYEKTKALKLLKQTGFHADGSVYEFEALNLVDGRRSVEEIAEFLSGAYGHVPLEAVAEYLQALESIGVIARTGH